MGTGAGRVVLHGASRRRKLDDDDDDEEYVVDDDEEEEEYVAAAASDEDEEEDERGDDEGEAEAESDADFDGDDDEFEEEDDDELEDIETPRPKRPAKVAGRKRKAKPAGSRRPRHNDDDDDDDDFDPDVDEEEEEEEEEDVGEEEEDDADSDDFCPIRTRKVRTKSSSHLAKRKKPAAGRQHPDLDEEDDDEEEEEVGEEEDDDPDSDDFCPLRPRKVRTKSSHLAKRKKPAAGRQHRKKKKRKTPKVSKGKARKGTTVRRRRKRWGTEDSEDDDEDADFIVNDDLDEENHRPRKKAKAGRKTRHGMPEPDAVAGPWPSVESDTSDFEFVTSDEELAENEAPVPAEPARIKGKKGRKKWGSGSESSSDFDYVISEDELKNLGVSNPAETAPPAPLPRRSFLRGRMEEKGKEPEEAWKQICGICLSEEQRATIQGVLNCCSHYFCFACIMEWSKVESRCPLCKRRFTAITKSSIADVGLGLRKAVIRVEKRDQVFQPTEEEMRRWLDPYENVACIECNRGGDDNLMLLCDICDSSAHTYCVGLGRQVPEGNWYCGGCRSGVEGPSNAQTQDRVVHRRESNIIPANSSSGSVGITASSGVFQRPPPIITQPSLQGFDLNLSPRETPEEDKQEESNVLADAVSTPTGRHATLDRRRAFNRRIRILLFRPRTANNVWGNGVQHERTIPGTEQNQRTICASTDINPSCSRANSMQSQQSSSSFVQPASSLTECSYGGGSNFQPIEDAKDELIPIVKKNLKRICAQSPLDQSAFKNVARRATHTILALSGIAHNKDMAVATPYPLPSHCNHACDGGEPAFLMKTCCSSCFNSFVGGVVSHIADMFS